MTYIVDFSVASLLFLCVTAGAYLHQRKAPSARRRLYTLMLFLGLGTLVFDILAALLTGADVAARHPLWLLYICNHGLLLCTQASGMLLLFYTFVLTGVYPRMRLPAKLACALPFFAVVALIFAAPFTRRAIYYLDEGNIYRPGQTHSLLYIVMALYFVATTIVITAYRRSTQRKRRITIYAFMLISLAAMGMQLALPQVLLNSTANALALTMMFHVLQSPSEHIDPLTGAFNRITMPILVGDLYEQCNPFSMQIYTLSSIGYINRTMGARIGDAVLCGLVDALRARNRSAHIVRVNGDVFAVIDQSAPEGPTARQLAETRDSLLAALVERAGIRPTVFCASLTSRDCPDAAAAIGTMEYIIAEQRRERNDLIIADTALFERCAYNNAVEAAIARALESDSVMVYYQPIHRSDGRLTAMEALCRINDEQLGWIAPDLFIRIAEQNGMIHRLGEQVLRRVCSFIKDNGVEDWQLDHVGVNLSVAQCLQDRFAEHFTGIVAEYGIRPGLISLEITETETVSSMPTVCRNMLRLSELGFEFLLDDFGSGNANFDYISFMPFACVKLDKSILWNAQNDRAQMVLLAGMARTLARLGLTSLCEGVETAEQSALLRELGFDLQQGYYFSKPLPPDGLLEYVARAREEAMNA